MQKICLFKENSDIVLNAMSPQNESTNSPPPSTINSTTSTVAIESESVGYLVLDGIAAGVAVYLFAGQITYCCRHFGCNFENLHSKKKCEEALLFAALIVAFMAICVRTALTLVTLNISIPSPFLDNILRTVIVFLYSVSLIITYSILWLRQRIIYLTPALFHLSNPKTRFLSKYFILYIVSTGVATFAAVTAMNFIETCFNDCFVVVLFVLVLIVWPLSCQIPLLFLMVFPLYKHQTSSQVTHHKYVRLMTRIAVLTAICLISDVTTIVTSVFVDVYFTPQQMNLIVNLVCVTLTPINWKEKILPCFITSK